MLSQLLADGFAKAEEPGAGHGDFGKAEGVVHPALAKFCGDLRDAVIDNVGQRDPHGGQIRLHQFLVEGLRIQNGRNEDLCPDFDASAATVMRCGVDLRDDGFGKPIDKRTASVKERATAIFRCHLHHQ